jgi:puromycin-sensitive aminopeptidase
MERFLKPTTPQDQIRMLYALAEFDSEELIRKTAEFAFSGEVKTQNAPFLLNRCIANRHHGNVAWEIVRKNWEKANADFPGNTIVRMVSSVTTLNTPELEQDVQGFFGEHGIPQATKTLEQVLERQRVNVSLRSREASIAAQALNA